MAKKPPKGKTSGLNTEDIRLWKDFTRDIAPYEEPDWVALEQAAEQSLPPKGETAIPEFFTNTPFIKPQSPATDQPAQLDARTEARLRRGQMPVEARLDLHGCTQDEAHRRLNEFVVNAQAGGKRCVLVITGKGLSRGVGVLRQKLPQWIAMPPLRGLVLKSYPAVQRDGGTGAWYLYLKRDRGY